ncbi:MAG: hypothetical protein P4L84_23020 [Isosphaeraceae bacterium]|nr:hypothetical protein [Isosphaeraceae bacterium]
MANTESSGNRLPRRRVRLTVRVLLLGIVLIAIWLSWVTNAWRSQRYAVETIKRLGGTVGYDFQYVGGDPDGTPIPNPQPPAPVWLRRNVGDEPFQAVVQVALIGDRFRDADLVILKNLPRLRTIVLFNCSKITNDGLEHLESIRGNVT